MKSSQAVLTLLREFPSLSGSAQPQFQNAGQAVWNNQRAGQQGPVQRQQLQNQAIGSNQQRAGPNARDHGQQSLDETFFPSGGANAGIDDYRSGGGAGGGIGQLGMGGQHQSGGGDEFPPLSRRGPGDPGADNRMNIMQSAAGGGYGGSNYPSESGSRVVSDSLRQGNERRGQQNGSTDNSLFSDLQTQQTLGGRDSTAPAGSTVDSPNGSGQPRARSPSQMSDRDRYGLGGLIEQIRNSDADSSNLAIGMDLTNLGLDLNSSEPIYPTFAGPFANGPTRPLQPDFVLPACYSVNNIHPIEEKIGSVTDETLFYIFYTMTRDVMQEQAAVELTQRNWRYHKVLQVWITKEPTYPEPHPIAQDVERGRYVIFNQHSWARESRDMILRYADLDDHITTAVPGTLP